MVEIVDFDQSPFGRDRRLAPLLSGEGARAYYRVGYLDCARDAVVALRHRRGGNTSAMPVLYLFRHYVELALKDVLSAAGAFAIDVIDRRFGHDLTALWAEAEKVFANFGVDPGAERRGLLDELFELDARADAFRYALDNRDRRQFAGIGTVNLDALLRGIDSMSELFELLLRDMERSEAEMDEAIADAIERDPY